MVISHNKYNIIFCGLLFGAPSSRVLGSTSVDITQQVPSIKSIKNNDNERIGGNCKANRSCKYMNLLYNFKAGKSSWHVDHTSKYLIDILELKCPYSKDIRCIDHNTECLLVVHNLHIISVLSITSPNWFFFTIAYSKHVFKPMCYL